MRKILITLALLCGTLASVHAQEAAKNMNDQAEADTVKPYLKYNRLPAFNILQMDSVTIFNTFNIPDGKKVALIFFSPDCGHCHRTTQRIIDSMDMLKDITFYFITPSHNLDEVKTFYAKFRLGEFPNVALVGRDYEFFFGSYYKVHVVPDIAMYDVHKKFVKLIEGETNAQAIYDAYH